MCRETTSGSNKAASPPLHTPCAPVPRSHCTLALKCKHFRFAVDEPCCPHHIKKRIKMMCCFCCMGQFMGENPTERLEFGGCLQTLALCTVCSFADTLRRFVRSPCTRRHGNSFVKITPPDENLCAYIINYKLAPVPFVNELMKSFLF